MGGFPAHRAPRCPATTAGRPADGITSGGASGRTLCRSSWVVHGPALVMLALLGACAPGVSPAIAPAPAVALRTTLDSIFRDTAFAYAHWGVVVQSPRTGETLFRHNAEKMFVPASNMKLVTAAAALQALGPDYRYRTEVGATGPIRDGVLRGDLVVRGSGDPSISARFHGGDARAVFRTWADSLRARGVRRIQGRVIGVDDVFDDVPYGRGWVWDDLDAAYSAPISGLSFNDNMVRVRVQPGRQAGTVASITVDPEVGYFRPNAQAQTAAAKTRSNVTVTRNPATLALIATGTIAADTSSVDETIAVPDPTQFFVTALRETLRQAGIEVTGPAVDADQLVEAGETVAPATPLFAHLSPPMREILPHFMKPSQNQIGEILLKTLGREQRGAGSYPAGREVVDSLVRVWGLNPRQLSMADGSGLSRYNLVAPDLLLGLLRYMASSPHFDVWYASLPVAGVDGTLANRMRGTPAERNIHAKTGTLSGVRALSGYVTTADGERLLFSTIVNHHTLSARDADRLVDAMLVRLASWRRDASVVPTPIQE